MISVNHTPAYNSSPAKTQDRDITGNLLRNQKEIDDPLIQCSNHSGMLGPGKRNNLYPSASCNSYRS